MDLSLGADNDAYRDALAVFIDREWTSVPETRDPRAFRLKAIERGYLYRHIPVAYGGSGQAPDPIKAMIVRDAFQAVGAPGELTTIGAKMLAPTLVARGAEWQKQQFVAATLIGDITWCQGYSEPDAGSDLASLRTSAVLDDGQWVINGQKIWTSGADTADFMFVLVRTEPDAPKHKGISYLLLDMKASGVTVRPLRQMNGAANFNEVFLDDARTPADWIVGDRGQGWSVARTTLSFERASINPPAFIDDLLVRLKSHARTTRRDGRLLIEDDRVIEAFGVLEGHALAHRYSVMRQVSMDSVGQDPGLSTLVNKLYGTDLGLRIAELAQDLIGDQGLLMPVDGVSQKEDDWSYWILRSLGVTIAGGASNIQRNIIAERGLGLPRDAEASA